MGLKGWHTMGCALNSAEGGGFIPEPGQKPAGQVQCVSIMPGWRKGSAYMTLWETCQLRLQCLHQLSMTDGHLASWDGLDLPIDWEARS